MRSRVSRRARAGAGLPVTARFVWAGPAWLGPWPSERTWFEALNDRDEGWRRPRRSLDAARLRRAVQPMGYEVAEPRARASSRDFSAGGISEEVGLLLSSL